MRLLEWKIRMDLAQYAARAVPPMSIDRIAAYKPKSGTAATKEEEPIDVVSRLHSFDDDGHAIKLGRAAGICQQVSAQYEDRDWMRLKGRENWMKVLHMIVDSVEGPGQRWVRTTGLEEAWKVSRFYLPSHAVHFCPANAWLGRRGRSQTVKPPKLARKPAR